MRLKPHLTFDGQCASAFKCYEKCLGGNILMLMTYGESHSRHVRPGTLRALRFGILVDQFRTPWSLNREKPSGTWTCGYGEHGEVRTSGY